MIPVLPRRKTVTCNNFYATGNAHVRIVRVRGGGDTRSDQTGVAPGTTSVASAPGSEHHDHHNDPAQARSGRDQPPQCPEEHRSPDPRGQEPLPVQRRQARHDRQDPRLARRGSRRASRAARLLDRQPPASKRRRAVPGRAGRAVLLEAGSGRSRRGRPIVPHHRNAAGPGGEPSAGRGRRAGPSALQRSQWIGKHQASEPDPRSPPPGPQVPDLPAPRRPRSRRGHRPPARIHRSRLPVDARPLDRAPRDPRPGPGLAIDRKVQGDPPAGETAAEPDGRGVGEPLRAPAGQPAPGDRRVPGGASWTDSWSRDWRRTRRRRSRSCGASPSRRSRAWSR